MSETTAEITEQLRRRLSGPMGEDDVTFLRDIQGYIDFIISNGFSLTAVSVLLQDLNELVRFGFDYAAARAHGFVPKVARYSRLTADSFGSTEEEDEES